MKRGTEKALLSETKRHKNILPSKRSAEMKVSDQEWTNANDFFKKQQFSLAHNWNVFCLLPWYIAQKKLSKKDTESPHSFIEVNDKIIALGNRKLEKKAILGEGNQGKVKVGQYENGEKVAVKVMENNLTNYDEKIAILKSQNLFLGEMQRPNSPKRYLVMPLVDGDNLETVLEQFALDKKQKLIIAIKCCEALMKVHSDHIVHGDIKPKNIMIDVDNDFKIKIIDFDASFILTNDKKEMELAKGFGTANYVAPEVKQANKLSGKKVMGYACDVYSLGVMFEKDLGLDDTLYKDMQKKNRHHRPSLQTIHNGLQLALSEMDKKVEIANRRKVKVIRK